MGLMSGFIQGAAAEGVKVFGSAMLKELEMQKAKQIAAYTSELRVGEDIAKEGRATAAAAAERGRIDTEAQATADKRGGGMMASARDQYAKSGMSPEDISAGLGAVDAAEAAGSYKQSAEPEDYMKAQGKHTELAGLKEKREDNIRLDKQQQASEHNMSEQRRLQEKQLNETMRHNKILESDRVSPADKLQLEGITSQISSAHLAEKEAAKALETARKNMADPAAVTQLEAEYRAAKAVTVATHTKYNETGLAIFGPDKWKTAPVAADASDKAMETAIAMLRAGKGTPEQFDKAGKLPTGTGAKILSAEKPAAPGAKVTEMPKANDEAPRGILNRARNAQPAIDMQAAESLRSIIEAKLRTKQPFTPREDAAAKTLGLL